MSFFEKNGSSTPIKEDKAMADLMYVITPDQLSSACATPDDDQSTSGASTNDDMGTPLSLPTDESMAATGSMSNFGQDKDSMMTSAPSKLRRSNAAAAAAQHSILPNGKKTKGRVKIKMEFIDNKLRRYTTFSKRKTGIMKKAYELSTLTGTQVMLLVASETGHVYTFATKKLQPVITSEAGKALIQTCLNSPDSSDGPPHFGESTALSANFHTSEIASLTPASLLFASGVTGNNAASNLNQSQQRQSSNSSARRSQKSSQLQQQHCANAIQDVLAAAQSRVGGSAGKIDNGDLSMLNDLGSNKGAPKGSYYNATELPTMVPPNASSRFSMEPSTPTFYSQTAESGIGDDDDADLENGDLSSPTGIGATKDQTEQDYKGGDASKLTNGSEKRRSMFQKHGVSPSSSSNSLAGNTGAAGTPAGSTLNNILHNIVASRQQQRQQAATSGGVSQNQSANQQINRRKRQHVGSVQFSGNKQQNIFGQSSAPNTQQASNVAVSSAQQFGSQLFPFAGLFPNAAVNGVAAGAQGNNQQAAFGLLPGLCNGAFFLPPGLVCTPPSVSFPEGAAAAFALQQMLASALAASSNGSNDGRLAQQQSQMVSSANGGRNSSPATQAAQQPMIPLSLPLSMMTANYLASQQSQRDMHNEDFDDGSQVPLDEEESD